MNPDLRDSTHASAMLDGVEKSGSPMEKDTMSAPSAFILETRFDIATVPDGGISCSLLEVIMLSNHLGWLRVCALC